MHEYHAAKTLVDWLLGEFGDVKPVTQVRIHAAVTYSPDALQQAYEMLTKDTPLEGSRLMIDEQPNAYECPSCRGCWTLAPDDLAGHLILCPFCGVPSSFEGSLRIEVAKVTTASGLSAPVAAGLPALVDAVLAEARALVEKVVP